MCLDSVKDYVDEIILADYIAAITQDEIDSEIELVTYLTDDQDLIAEIKADPEIDAEFINAFRQNMVILGYNPDNPVDLRNFVELNIAKQKIVKEFILDATEGTYLIEDIDIQNYYEATVYNDACVVDVRFSSFN